MQGAAVGQEAMFEAAEKEARKYTEDFTQLSSDKAAAAEAEGVLCDDTPMVKDLRNLAWNMQSKFHKPGVTIPEDFKRKGLKLTSTVTTFCHDCEYISPADFSVKAEEFTAAIQAKMEELDQLTKKEENRLRGLCFAMDDDGKYGVRKLTGSTWTYPIKDEKAKENSKAADTAGFPLATNLSASRQQTPQDVSSATLSSTELKELCNKAAEGDGSLSLRSRGLKDADLHVLLSVLEAEGPAEKLTRLDLSQNEIQDAGVQRLVVSLSKTSVCPNLADLRLGANPLGELGTTMLRNGLQVLRKKLTVVLEDQGPEDEEDRHEDRKNGATVVEDGGGPVGESLEAGPSPSSSKSCAATPGTTSCSSAAAHGGAGYPTPTSTTSGSSSAQLESQASSRDSAQTPSPSPAATTLSPSEKQVPPPALHVTKDYDVEVVRPEEDGGLQQVVVTFRLPPTIESARELDLDVAEKKVLLRGPGGFESSADLPLEVQPESCQAKFSKKKWEMRVSITAG